MNIGNAIVNTFTNQGIVSAITSTIFIIRQIVKFKLNI